MAEENKDKASVAINEQTVEKLASMTKTVVGEELKALFGEDLSVAIENAKQQRQNQEIIAKQLQAKKSRSKHESMSLEQQGEFFRCAILGGTPDPDLDEDGVVTQALGPATPSKGGYAVPVDFQLGVEKKADEPAIVWPLITKRRTSRDSVTKREVTAYPSSNKGTAAKSSSTTSSDDVTEQEPTYGELTWTMRYYDMRTFIKIDLIEDSPDDIVQELMDLAADAFAIDHESEPIVGPGSGSSRPLGLMDASAGITTVDFGGAPTIARILNFAQEIPQRYRARSLMLMEGQTLFSIIAELAENVRAAQFLLNKLPNMEESAYVTSGKILAGDFSRYVVYINRLMYMMSGDSPRNFSKEITIVEKWDGQPVLTDAFRIATGVVNGS